MTDAWTWGGPLDGGVHECACPATGDGDLGVTGPGTVLVTGGSGFLGSHTIARLLADGHRVRTTVRNPAREVELRATLSRSGVDPRGRLACSVADLEHDAGWSEAAAGCDRVLHLASPFPPASPKHADELVVPARDGTIRVLRAARDAGARRVVLTSSFAAVGYGHAPRATPFDETDWTDPAAGVSAYVKSKTVAERAAWQFVAGEGSGLELAVINPVGIFGPVLGPDYASSIGLLKRLLDGAVPAAPRLWFGVVDVRDVVDLHLRAMTAPAAAGERFLAVAGDFLRIVEIAGILRRLPGAGGAAGTGPRAARRGRPAGRPLRPRRAGDPARAGQAEERHQRQGAAPAGLVAPLERGGAGGCGGRSDTVRLAERRRKR
jgi:dihydroflavonol-4-reductase